MLCTLKAAVEEGIVPGGGVVYIKAIGGTRQVKGQNERSERRCEIVKKALKRQLNK